MSGIASGASIQVLPLTLDGRSRSDLGGVRHSSCGPAQAFAFAPCIRQSSVNVLGRMQSRGHLPHKEAMQHTNTDG